MWQNNIWKKLEHFKQRLIKYLMHMQNRVLYEMYKSFSLPSSVQQIKLI